RKRIARVLRASFSFFFRPIKQKIGTFELEPMMGWALYHVVFCRVSQALLLVRRNPREPYHVGNS
ncbi:MAG: hypothetical protein O7D30_06505, partial [Rickettsia endosymbiont of Ixodes persulcatus]|nr:hypothetical protein [Rickettsia endosymbiont of Ixodes persulcatus]